MLIRWLYTLLLTFFAPFLLFGLYKKKEGKPSIGSRWKEHFGFTPKLESDKRPIWIHAVSVGETIAVAPLIKQLKLDHPDTEIVLTTTTPTGAEQAAKLGKLVKHRYMPLDFPFAVKGFIKAIKPCKLVIMETELWPNTIYTVAKNDIPISVINARLSERSYRRYSKIQPIFNLLSKNIEQLLCQYKDDAERFVKLGVDSNKVTVTGSIKFDIRIEPNHIEHGNRLREKLGNNRPVWIAASTHIGEDQQVLAAHREILKSTPNPLLILVPRHPERFSSVFELCQKEGFAVQRRTNSNEKELKNTEVYLADTMGEMLALIQAADICFMGGSLIGNKVGGHNVLEPAALAKPVLSGPSYYNFTEIVHKLLAHKAIIITNSPMEISKVILELLGDRKKLSRQGELSEQCVNDNKGALVNTLNLITK
ncbi:lipid IV(A) 3-deoxy-D-manno-octulosonic acid transferase [Vibrio europaeus]|uniref:3-deoxy-D-manno-octulosonic acid transferase n=1 Tax=Vibrio europaeus TaxID=300876 RepID=A0A178J9G7_9VIBR|nr:lipid IV(A) 3-deoxy-D-manno-octulosonic acid transferase [Vibrio europaeus]MDC5703121.1 lipid IV(A) 3-deoxy-D-manno-octulosonic acid transferase [Vibrio europaeus]MDC5708647.1 lipid IV(A) 3-deoxy-D-manno-octulosonic acid transferase [Vibrio europaeus]MDC5713013.1 lipid IV(A) 3-deoxy-D-manno-octulosonic acid transferase [Vibrio europaeus]MDC5718026.1 lipid IV(A) 3-deoxy-D-manno-octulosonic acid transferase [Vibrio europaeus]MDC5725433.1 lipid IV(A) 3-deoxy-D-manno-octulosonic acid transferas